MTLHCLILMTLLALCCLCNSSIAQDSAATSSEMIPVQYLEQVSAKSGKLNAKLEAKTAKTLARFQRQ